MAQRLNELLGTLPALQQAQALGLLQRQFDAVLPAKFQGLVQVVALEQGELRALCENGAIASRLRLETQALALQLQTSGLKVRSISFRVRPASSRQAAAVRAKPPLPTAAHNAFSLAAKKLEDGEVKTALEQLLKHHQK